MINQQQGTGISERVVYGAVTFLVIKYGSKFGFSADDAAWLAGGLLAFGGGAVGWYRNRPVALLNRASTVVPENAKLVITPTLAATHVEKVEVRDLANAANGKDEARA